MAEIPLHLLYIAPYPPSPIRVRTYQTIRHLAEIGHRITVAALSDSFQNDDTLDELRALNVTVHIVSHDRKRSYTNVLRELLSQKPLWAAYCESPQMAKLLQRLCAENRFDCVQIEHLRAAQFADFLPSELPIVYDAVDCLTDLQTQIARQASFPFTARLLATVELPRLHRYEAELLDRFPITTVTAQSEADALQKSNPNRSVTVVPNAVDSDYFQPQDDESVDDTLPTVVFSGKMGYAPNRDAADWFARDILPRIVPRAKLIVVGSGSERLHRYPNTTTTGSVPDIRPYLATATIAVSPMRVAVGMQNKILEAIAMGKPVVCTSLAARPFSELVDLGAVRVADTPEEFIAACSDWLNDRESASAAGKRGSDYLREHFRWENTALSFSELHYQATNARATGSHRAPPVP